MENHRAINTNYTVSKNVPPLQLAIIFTYTVRLQHSLAQMLPRKYAIKVYFIFPRHLTSASALPGETGNPEIVFLLKCCMLFHQKNKTQFKNITWSELNHLHCQNDRLDAPDRT